MTWVPEVLSYTADTPTVTEWAHRQMRRLSMFLLAPLFETVQMAPLAVEPTKPRDGMMAYADGVNWDPGSGEGLYAYYNGTWNSLG